MNDSVLNPVVDNTKATASVENNKNIAETSDGSKVDKSTGEIINNDDDKKSTDTKTSSDTKTDAKDTTPKVDDTKTLSPEEKENAMREEVKNLNLKNLDIPLMYEVMAVPSVSDYEYRIVTYLILWARKHGIEHKFDDYGNLYFIKGKPEEGHYYPCVTAHLDTVQDKQKAYVLTGAELDLKTRKRTDGRHDVYVDGMGIGADDRNAIVIALHMFLKFDVLKGAFYLGEEIGCQGSKHMDSTFFDDVSYVIGFDSPELNRAAWHLMTDVKMFTADFYKKHMKPICDKWGMTKFYSESITDEGFITKDTGLVTMNFGNGGYNPHSPTEYFIVEELDHALGMGIELVETIPTNEQYRVKTITWVKDKDGKYHREEKDLHDDEAYLKSLGDNSKYTYYNNYGGSYRSYGTNSSTNRSDGYLDKPNTDKKEDTITKETLQFIVDIYDDRLQEIENDVKNKCIELKIDFNKAFKSIFSKEIKF